MKETMVACLSLRTSRDFPGLRSEVSFPLTTPKFWLAAHRASLSRLTHAARESASSTDGDSLPRSGESFAKSDPDIVSMENVPQLEKEAVFARFMADLQSAGYRVTYSNVNCWIYGVPQTRTRLVLFASKYGPINLLQATHFPSRRRTVRQTIGRLEPIAAGGISPRDKLHRASSLDPQNLRRIKASKPGGTWRDWSDRLVANCHKAETGETYSGVYGRMSWDGPAPTITTECHGFGNGRFGHPEQNRAISLREAA